MNKKNQPNKMEEKPESSSFVVSEPMVEYHTKSEISNSFDEERLYTHGEVFKEFAKRLNSRIGTNIPL